MSILKTQQFIKATATGALIGAIGTPPPQDGSVEAATLAVVKQVAQTGVVDCATFDHGPTKVLRSVGLAFAGLPEVVIEVSMDDFPASQAAYFAVKKLLLRDPENARARLVPGRTIKAEGRTYVVEAGGAAPIWSCLEERWQVAVEGIRVKPAPIPSRMLVAEAVAF